MRAAIWAVYALLIIALFTIAVHVKLWFSGIEESGVATLYRTRVKTVYVEVPRDKKAEKGLERVTVPCRSVQVLVPKDDHIDRSESPGSSSHTLQAETSPGNSHMSDTSRMAAAAFLVTDEGQKEAHFGSDTSVPGRPKLQPPSYLLGVFRLPPLPEGGSARATLDEDGVTHLEVKAKALRLFQLGSLREIGVWGGVRLDDSSVRTWALLYQQDIVRIGPAWLRGRAEYGDEGFGSSGKAELGIVVRF